ncbi:MAG: CehA/McbA family metallohydrolase [Planctomycetales bacterium]|nr:CehA/McbA family metallohydrolase [Planctomycetales bacterium]
MASRAFDFGHYERHPNRFYLVYWLFGYALVASISLGHVNQTSAQVPLGSVEGQPLAMNASRILDALNYLGYPLESEATRRLQRAIADEDSGQIQAVLDPHALCGITINPELRVKVVRGTAKADLQQAAYTPVIIKVLNDATATQRLRLSSPQAGPVYAGAAEAILLRQAQTELNKDENRQRDHRFLELEIFSSSPMTSSLSGLQVEYLLALIYSSEAGSREATLIFDIGEGTQDIGFRSELPILFSIRQAIPVELAVHDHDGQPTTGRFEFRDSDGRVYPPQAKRLAPDFFFQPQIYRAHGSSVLLPPGKLIVSYSRGPEYREQTQTVEIKAGVPNRLNFELERWIDPSLYGYYSGDHHIHGAGCSHYDNPTQGVTPQDMFHQVKGEGLNVGCVLTWGPCFDFQRQYFSPQADTLSEDKTVLKYDLEISGFGSAALGHVCLLNLTNQTYPGSEGTSVKGWPTWTVPVMRWAKEQGGVTGYPHSALHVDPELAARWLMRVYDTNQDQVLGVDEIPAVLPEPWNQVDIDGDMQLTTQEITASADRAADLLPNNALPALNGGGAMEIFVSTSEAACDFISAMDTARIPEWNTWYHLMNCGFPLKLSGETDFPCMSSRRVGQGRVYVYLGATPQVDFTTWCEGLARGESYVADGYAHAFDFNVAGQRAGATAVQLDAPATVKVSAKVCFAAELPRAVAYGTHTPPQGPRMAGDTVNLHAPRELGTVAGGVRRCEIVMNGQIVGATDVPADGLAHSVEFDVPVSTSSWIALRQFPQLHTNPVQVLVAEKPIRTSRDSALWCAECVRLLWHNRRRFIAPNEQPAAKQTYERALRTFLQRAQQAVDNQGKDLPNIRLELE